MPYLVLRVARARLVPDTLTGLLLHEVGEGAAKGEGCGGWGRGPGGGVCWWVALCRSDPGGEMCRVRAI